LGVPPKIPELVAGIGVGGTRTGGLILQEACGGRENHDEAA
jgi:hypothetical protein